MRTILLVNVTTATLRGRRSARFIAHSGVILLFISAAGAQLDQQGTQTSATAFADTRQSYLFNRAALPRHQR